MTPLHPVFPKFLNLEIAAEGVLLPPIMPRLICGNRIEIGVDLQNRQHFCYQNWVVSNLLTISQLDSTSIISAYLANESHL